MVSEEILEFSTKKSLFSEISFKIDGVKYVCRRLIQSVMDKQYLYEIALKDLGDDSTPGKISELYNAHLLYLFPDLKKETLLQLEDDEIRMIMNQIVVAKMMNRKMKVAKDTVKKALEDKDSVKNVERPGKKKTGKSQ